MLLAPHQAVVPVKDQNLPKGRPFLLLKKFEIRGKIINPVLLYKLSAGCQFFRGSLQFTLRDPVKIPEIFYRSAHIAEKETGKHHFQGFFSGKMLYIHIREHLLKTVPFPIPFPVKLILK